MIRRPTVDEYFIIQAMHASSRGSCIRRRVGCILTNEYNHVLATGYNGPPAGEPNCTEHPCEGARLPSGTGLNLCRATHAEHNAIKQCSNIFNIRTAYVTASPCNMCIDKLLATSCQRIVFLQEYPHNDARLRWIESGLSIDWIFDLIDDESPVHMFANIYGFGSEK